MKSKTQDLNGILKTKKSISSKNLVAPQMTERNSLIPNAQPKQLKFNLNSNPRSNPRSFRKNENESYTNRDTFKSESSYMPGKHSIHRSINYKI